MHAIATVVEAHQGWIHLRGEGANTTDAVIDAHMTQAWGATPKIPAMQPNKPKSWSVFKPGMKIVCMDFEQWWDKKHTVLAAAECWMDIILDPPANATAGWKPERFLVPVVNIRDQVALNKGHLAGASLYGWKVDPTEMDLHYKHPLKGNKIKP